MNKKLKTLTMVVLASIVMTGCTNAKKEQSNNETKTIETKKVSQSNINDKTELKDNEITIEEKLDKNFQEYQKSRLADTIEIQEIKNQNTYNVIKTMKFQYQKENITIKAEVVADPIEKRIFKLKINAPFFSKKEIDSLFTDIGVKEKMPDNCDTLSYSNDNMALMKPHTLDEVKMYSGYFSDLLAFNEVATFFNTPQSKTKLIKTYESQLANTKIATYNINDKYVLEKTMKDSATYFNLKSDDKAVIEAAIPTLKFNDQNLKQTYIPSSDYKFNLKLEFQ